VSVPDFSRRPADQYATIGSIGQKVGRKPGARLSVIIDTEQLMNEVISDAGGQRVSSLIPESLSHTPKNADYFFQQQKAIVELKSLQTELFTPAYVEKLRKLAFAWQRQGFICVYGTAVIEMRNVPPICQRQWLRLVTHSLQTRIVSKANRQINDTKKLLNVPDAKGTLLLANDSSIDLDPYNLIVLISNILRKTRPDGSPQYSSLDAVAFFSCNLPIVSPVLSTPAFWWFNGHRPSSTQELSTLLMHIESCWYRCLSRRVGYDIPRVPFPEHALENLTYLHSKL